MKICIFTETYYPVIGGGETQARALAEGLADSGFGVTVLTRRSDPALARHERYGTIEVRRLGPVGPQHYKKWGLLLSGALALWQLRQQYDLVFVSGFRVIGIITVIMSRLLDKACVLKADSLGEMSGDFFTAGLEKWGFNPDWPLFRILLGQRNRILRGTGQFVAISSAITQELMGLGIPPHRITSIPNSVDTTRFYPATASEKASLRDRLRLPLDCPIAVYTGRLVSYKGLPQLVRAWQKISASHPEALLVLVGSGGMDIHNCETELKAFVQANDLCKQVIFTGAVDNVSDYLRAADVFVFPSENEAFGIAVIEAQACGLPVIATNAGGLYDLVEHEQTGLIIEPRNEPALITAFERLLNDQELAQQLGQRARKMVEKDYATTAVTAQYAALFEKLVKPS